MSNKGNEYRGRRGNRLEGRALAARVAQEVNGMMLAQAWVTVKSSAFKLQINKMDGVPRTVTEEGNRDDRVIVDVVSGFVRKSWAG